MLVDPFSIIYLLGALQAIFLLIALFRKQVRGMLSSRLLIAILVCILLVTAQYTLVVNKLHEAFPYLMSISTAAWFSIAPFTYLYVLASCDEKFKLRRIHLLFFTIVIYNMVQWVLESFGVFVGFHAFFHENWLAYTYLWLGAYLSTSLLFTALTLRALMKSDRELVGVRKIAWMRMYLIAFAGALVASAVLLCFISEGEYMMTYERGLVILFEVFVLVLAFRVVYFSANLNVQPKQKYTKATLSDDRLREVAAKLEHFMASERPYLNKKVSLSSLSIDTEIPQTQLSQIFSQLLNTSFYDYMNQFRLKEVEARMLSGEYKQYTITAIAEDCGFNSKASFYRFFKNTHNCTPSEFMKRHAVS